MHQRGRKSIAKLAVVPVTAPTPPATMRRPPPDHLSAEMREWWEAVAEKYDLDPHHFHLMQGAAEAWDRLQQAGSALREHGLTYRDGDGKVRVRPEVAIERDARIGYARLLRELGLDQATFEPYRSGVGIRRAKGKN